MGPPSALMTNEDPPAKPGVGTSLGPGPKKATTSATLSPGSQEIEDLRLLPSAVTIIIRAET